MPTNVALAKDIKAVKVGTRFPYKVDPGILVITPATIIRKYWEHIGGSPGDAVSVCESIGGGWRVRYKNGAIYYGGSSKHPNWVYGDIGDRYNAIGGPTSWLGFPTSDEKPFAQGGRFSEFENGAIYWWADTGAIESAEKKRCPIGIGAGRADEHLSEVGVHASSRLGLLLDSSRAASRIGRGHEAVSDNHIARQALTWCLPGSCRYFPYFGPRGTGSACPPFFTRRSVRSTLRDR